LKAFIGFNIRSDQLEKIDKIKVNHNSNRSETLRYIIDEYFKTGQLDMVEELESIKRQNRDLKYQLESLRSVLVEQNEQALAMLLMIGGKDEQFRSEAMKRFPQFWRKK
jgi:hypothetical protein